MTFSRRTLAKTLPALCLLPLIPMVACSTTQEASMARIAQEARAIAQGVTSALAQMSPTLSDTVRAKLTDYLHGIQAAAAAITVAATEAEAQPKVQQIMSYLAAFASAIPGLGLPAAIAQIVANLLAAAQVITPILAANVGLAGAPRIPPAMTEAKAIGILTAAH